MRRLTFLCLFLLLNGTFAQNLTIGGSWPAGGLVAIQDLPLESGRAGLGVMYRNGPGLLLHLRHTSTWGPLGNLVLDLDAAGTMGGSWTAGLAGRAVLGPASLRLRLAGYDDRDLPAARAPDDAFLPRFITDRPLAAIDLGVSWRVARDLLVLNDSTLVFGSRGTALRSQFELRMPRLAGPHELRLRAALLQPFGTGDLDAWASIAAGLRIDRGRAPAWGFMLLAGGTAAGPVSAGVEADVTWEGLKLGMRLEPWRNDLPVLELNAGWSGPLAGGDLSFSARVSGSPAGFGLATSWQLPLPGMR